MLVAALLVAALVALPSQLALALAPPGPDGTVDLLRRISSPGLPAWLPASDGSTLTALLTAPARMLVQAGPIHALVLAIGLAIGGVAVEVRFGHAGVALIFLTGAVVAILASQVAIGSGIFPELDGLGATGDRVQGAGGGVFALFGAILLDIGRRGGSPGIFRPLVAPLILHGAILAIVPGPWSTIHGIGLAVGALIVALWPGYRTE